jgi:hypothetical protein
MRISVYPSGAAFAAISVPMSPPAPPTFSMMTGLSSRWESCAAIERPRHRCCRRAGTE